MTIKSIKHNTITVNNEPIFKTYRLYYYFYSWHDIYLQSETYDLFFMVCKK